ncbi:DDE-domain-containing protein, partial [Wolfiporia cocos MD-104 SS10]
PIVPECTYGTDETGLQKGIGTHKWVIGHTGESIQYQQHSDGQENITVIVTICGDGMSIAPTVYSRVPVIRQACIGYSKKGYTAGEIGVEWIKQFDVQTKDKSHGHQRLLLIDGHTLHYRKAFLDYAHAHQIVTICYPSHSIHIYQGLDVVIFSVLKWCWSQAWDKYELQTGEKVSKSNFLSIYGKVHLTALTAENIKAVFCKTGVIPLDWTVIYVETMAPSQTSLTWAYLPFQPPSLVQA